MYAIKMKTTIEGIPMDTEAKIATILTSNLPEALKEELLSKLVDYNEEERRKLKQAIRNEIIGILLEADHEMTPSELMEVSPFLGQCSTQKISRALGDLQKETCRNGYRFDVSPIIHPEASFTAANKYGCKILSREKRITEVRTYTHPDGSAYTVRTHRVAVVWYAERV